MTACQLWGARRHFAATLLLCQQLDVTACQKQASQQLLKLQTIIYAAQALNQASHQEVAFLVVS